jgi:RimJ/RimL family protein N-acetyltransferase
MTIPTITTSRLALRPFTERDVEPLHTILGAEGILRYFPQTDPPSRERVERLIAGQLKHWQEWGYGWWAVEPRPGNELAGWAGLQYLPDTDEVEVGYLLGKSYWGRGLATEAAGASLGYGFARLEVQEIVGIVHPENVASQRVLEKIGMRFVERAEYFGMECKRYLMEREAFEGARACR